MIDLKTKRILSVFLAVIIMCISALPCLAAVEYPENVTKEQALSTITKFDKAINGFMETQDTSLKETVLPQLYSDEILSAILLEVYKMLEDQAGDALSTVGIDASIKNVAQILSQYPSVSQRLSSYSLWIEADLTGVQWGVESKSDFAVALSKMFTPFNDIFYALLCSGSYSLNLLVGIKGSNGYETAIIPTLKALGCKDYLSADEFYAQAESDKGKMIYNIAYDVLSFAEDALETPCETLSAQLPSIAYYFTSGGFDNAVSTLMAPLRLQVLNIATLIPIEAFSAFLSDTESFTQNFTLNINDMLSATGLPMAPIDLNLMASLGTVNDDGTVTADKADSFIVILRWLLETVKLNEGSLGEFLPQAETQTLELISGVFDKETDALISLLISLFNQTGAVINDSQWSFPQFVPGQVTYTQNLTAEKYQRVADNVDDLLNQFVAEMSEEKSVGDIISKELYSAKTLSVVLKNLFSALETEDISAVATMLGIDVTPAGIGTVLRAKGFDRAGSALSGYSKWSDISDEGIDLGFEAGDRAKFVSILASAFSPLNNLLGMILAEDKFVLFDAVEIYGSNGYNTAIIPIYEALGCEDSTIRTHEEFKELYKKGKGVEALLDPVISLLDRIIEKPVYTVLQILPNLLYFLESDGISVCINNLIYPFTGILSQLGMESVVDLSVIEGIDVNALITQLLASVDLGIVIAPIDMTHFASLGTAVQKTSKRVVGGQQTAVAYIQADMPALCVSLLRIMAATIKDPANSGLFDTLLETGTETIGSDELPEGTEDIIASFAQGIVNDINAMTVDQTVEWLYKLFFRERVTAQDTFEEDYMPTIIYKPEKNYTFVLLIIAICMLIPVSVIARNKIRLRRMEEYYTESSQEV